MGYDMYWLVHDPEDVEAYEDARSRWNEAIAVRNAIPKDEQGSYDFATDRPTRCSARYAAAAAEARRLYGEMYRAERYYFHLTGGGMGCCISLMSERGMVYESDHDRGLLQEAEALGSLFEATYRGHSPNDVEWFFGEGSDDRPKDLVDTPAMWADRDKWKAKHDEWLRSGVQERPGIPDNKLGTNDGWLVSPIECLGALKMWERWCESEGHEITYAITEWWPRWLAFLAGAADHGGFEVN